MINIIPRIATGIIVLLTSLHIYANDTAEKNDNKLAVNFSIAYEYNSEAQDTPLLMVRFPRPHKAPPIPPPPEKTPNLFKRMAEIFKFKKYSHLREQARVTVFIDSLIGDSIYASEQNVKFLMDVLADTANQNIDSLRSKVKLLRDKEHEIFAKEHFLDSTRADLDSRFTTLEEYVRVVRDKYAAKDASDKNLSTLASRIFPIINVNMDIKLLTEKMNTLRILNNIQDSLRIPRIMPDTATNNEKYYWVKTKNKVEVYGFYNYFTGAALQIDKLNYINTFIYNSLFINSQTGDIRAMNGWDTAQIISDAQNAGCSVVVTFTIKNGTGADDFLNITNSQDNFIKTAISLMEFRNATGINISFNSITPGEDINYTSFINKLYKKLKQADTRFKLFLTIPATTSGNNYNLSALAPISDRIIIDFSQNYQPFTGSPMTSLMRLPLNIPAASMASLERISEVIPFFMKAGITPDKIVVCIPYGAAKWHIVKGYENKLIEYISYSTIKKNYPFPGYINHFVDSTGIFMMDSIGRKNDTVRRIFYENEFTIGEKYKLILKTGVAGVAVKSLGDDFGYTGLWNEMFFAFAIPDTVFDKSIAIKKYTKDTTLSWLDKLQRQLALYAYILQNPCEVCFENVKDSAEREKIHQYLLDLDIDSKMKKANADQIKEHKDTYRSHFEFVNHELTALLFKITLSLVIILLILAFIYAKKVRYEGDKWLWKKKMQIILTGGVVLFVLFLFSLLFVSDDVPLFGTRISKNAGYSDDYADAINASGGDSVRIGYCEPDPTSNCINMPLPKLLILIIVILGVGFLLTRTLVVPLLKRDVIP